jgi:hypothetical protein
VSGAANARAARAAVVGLGGAFMISPEAKAAGKDGGLRGRELYVVGRGGVIEDATASGVVAAFGFWEPATVTSAWESGTAKAPAADVVARYSEVCRDWGRHRWDGLAGVDRLAELLGAVSAAADPQPGRALHAGWKAQPLPDDAPARAAQLLHVLREHRGGAHQDAVRTVGLSPLEAVLAGPGGPGNAAFFGWQEPLPEVTDDQRDRWARAEDLTDELAAPAYAVLSADQVTELGALLTAAAAAAH